jgi:hypothetical protein
MLGTVPATRHRIAVWASMLRHSPPIVRSEATEPSMTTKRTACFSPCTASITLAPPSRISTRCRPWLSRAITKASSAQLTEVEEALLHEMLLRQLEVEALLADVV